MSDGIFSWKRRMGVHLAYHRNYANKIIHAVCIPFVLAALIKLLSLLSIGGIGLGWIAVTVVGTVCCLVDPLGGALMVAWLVGAHYVLAPPMGASPWHDAVGAVAVFVALFVFQTKVGHGAFEGGPDDTDKNVEEFKRTLNLIPLILVLYYHLVEVLFSLGYRRAARREVEAHMKDEVERMQREESVDEES